MVCLLTLNFWIAHSRSIVAGAQTSSGLAHAWIKAHDKAKSTSPPLAIFTTIALAIGAYHPRVNVVQRNLFGAAALLSVGILPFTLIGMRNTVNALYAKLDVGPIQREIDVGIKQAELHETEILVERWSAQNTVRGQSSVIQHSLSIPMTVLHSMVPVDWSGCDFTWNFGGSQLNRDNCILISRQLFSSFE